MASLALFLGSLASVWVFLAWLACGFLAGHVAGEKDRCGLCWFCLGVIFGPLALIASVGVPDNRKLVPVVGPAKEDGAPGEVKGYVFQSKSQAKDPPLLLSLIIGVIVILIAVNMFGAR